MKKNFKFFALVFGCFLIISTFIFLSFNNIKNQFIKFVLPKIQKTIKEESGLDLRFEKVSISFTKFLQLSPAIKIQKISIEDALNIDEIIVVINLKSLIDKEIKIKKIIIEKLLLTLEENEKREIKIKNIKIKSTKKDQKQNLFKSIKKLSIDEISIKNSTINFYPLNLKEAIVLNNLNLTLSDIDFQKNKSKTGSYEFSSNLFSNKSYLKSQGKFGPFDIDKKLYPIIGQEEAVIYLVDIPSSIKKQIFTKDIILAPSSKVKQSAQIKGDLNTSINGSGDIEISNISLGANPEFRLNLNSIIYHDFSFYLIQGILEANLKSKTFKIQNKNQNFGELNFKARLSNNLHNQFSSYRVTGSFNGLEIKDALNCFTKYRNVLSGTFAINSFDISSSGANPEALSNNTKGKAYITIKKGSLYILKSLTRYQNLIDQIFTNAEDFTQKISGEFIDLKTNIEINGKDMHLTDIVINVAPVKIYSEGFIKDKGIIDFTAELFIDKIKTSVPLILSGSIEKPKIKPDLKKLSVNKTNELVDSILELGIRSLTKKKAQTPDSNPAQPSSQNTSSTQETIPTDPNPNLSKEEKRKAMINSLIMLGIQAVNEASKQKTSNGETLSKP